MAKSFLVLVVFVLSGCVAAVFGTADQLNQISIGMTKADVIKTLGVPKSTSANDSIEYLQYSWVKTAISANANFPTDYFVALKNGRVTGYGQKGDFGSTAAPARRVEIHQTVQHEKSGGQSNDIYLELKKMQDLKESGVLTDEEFQKQKKRSLDGAS